MRGAGGACRSVGEIVGANALPGRPGRYSSADARQGRVTCGLAKKPAQNYTLWGLQTQRTRSNKPTCRRPPLVAFPGWTANTPLRCLLLDSGQRASSSTINAVALAGPVAKFTINCRAPPMT